MGGATSEVSLLLPSAPAASVGRSSALLSSALLGCFCFSRAARPRPKPTLRLRPAAPAVAADDADVSEDENSGDDSGDGAVDDVIDDSSAVVVAARKREG